MLTVLHNANVVDVVKGEVNAECQIVIEDSTIMEVGPSSNASSNANRIDMKGKYVMPGLIDCHCHVLQSSSDFSSIAVESPFYAAAKAFEIMRGMLQRGFTTIRDVGGADWGIARTVADDIVEGPNVIYGGKALTATGGHGDYRSAGQNYEDTSYWVPRISRLADGVDELRRAVRDEVRKGAHHIKIMANGGVASPTDRITSDQYSEQEIAAVVDEAQMAGLYVCSHTYTASSIKRALRNGVRSIEHGNLADQEAIDLIKTSDAFLVPTLIVFRALASEGVADGLNPNLVHKIGSMIDRGMEVVEKAHRAGVRMAFGTDLIGRMHRRQSEEFELRADLVPPADLIRSATVTGAMLVRREDDLGQIKNGFKADLIALDNNPLDDVRLLARPHETLKLIMKNGRVVSQTSH